MGGPSRMAGRTPQHCLRVVAWLVLACTAAAQSAEFKRKHADARAGLIKAQLALAEWCSSKELFLERDQAFQRVLTIDPDNLDARKGLRFARNPDGSWKAPPPREAKNRNAKALEAFPAQRSKSVATYRDSMLDALKQENEDPAARSMVFDDVLLFDPDDARVHELLCEVKVENTWVLADTASAKKRRGEIKALVQESRAAVGEPDAIEPSADETALLESWSCGLRGPGLRVLSTTDAADCRAVYDACHAIQELVDKVFEVEAKLPDDFAIYILPNAGEKDTFVDRLSGLKPDERAYLKTLTSTSVHNGVHVVVWDPDPKIRLDNAVRHTLTHLLQNAFSTSAQHGWVWDGLGLYLARELTGTRLTWFTTKPPSGDATDVALRGVLATSDTNWMNEALKILDGDAPPRVTALLSRSVDDLTAADMVVLYAFSAYVLEARADKAAHFVRRSCAGESPTELAQTILGLTSDELQARVLRWLKERR